LERQETHCVVTGRNRVRMDGLSLSQSCPTDGTEMAARVDGFSESVGEGVISLGSYNLNVFQFGTTSFPGRTITFMIDRWVAAETGIWQSFGADVVNLTVDGYR